MPVRLGEKDPSTVGWNLRHNCVTDPALARTLMNKNIGLAHAYCHPAPTCALDVDKYPFASKWLACRGVDVRALVEADDAVVIWSGKRHSIKALYRLPAALGAMPSVKIFGPDGNCALELRCASRTGRTVQDVLPPSLHPDGHQYQWVGKGNPLSLPPIPDGLLSVWRGLAEPVRCASTRDGARPIHTPEESPREIANVIDALNRVSADCSYDTWRNIVWAVLSTEWNSAEEIARQWSESAPNRFDGSAFERVVGSYRSDHPSGITVGTLFYHAKRGGQSD